MRAKSCRFRNALLSIKRDHDLMPQLLDLAVLDVNLGFENSLSFAAYLRSANTPFVFASGYGEQEVLGASRVSELTVSKPYNLESLRGAIGLTLSRSL
jgi:DNA-binding response OmpR family regulator